MRGSTCAAPSTTEAAAQIAAVILLFVLYSPVARIALSVYDRYPHGVLVSGNGASDTAFFLEEDLSIRVASPFHAVSSRADGHRSAPGFTSGEMENPYFYHRC